jgi:hypothetical protein
MSLNDKLRIINIKLDLILEILRKNDMIDLIALDNSKIKMDQPKPVDHNLYAIAERALAEAEKKSVYTKKIIF